jgi:pimeloyl-ACP methyl ester carboxylesterase
MLVDLVQVTASDGVRLHGALEQSVGDAQAPVAAPSKVDVWLCLHGTGSNFYSASTLAGIAPKLLAEGADVLRVNTRGHDIVCTAPSTVGRGFQGAAFERIDDAPLDLAAWIAWLTQRGYRRISLLGHSLGAVKAILTLAQQQPAGVAALVAVSPPRLSYDYFCETPRGEGFKDTFRQAQQLVSAGRGDELMLVRFPLTYYVSAAGFVDRYGPEERYNVLRLLGQVRVPTLVTYGSTEVQGDFAFRGMPEAVEALATEANRLQVAVIAGADHIYTACHDSLAARIGAWARRLREPAG